MRPLCVCGQRPAAINYKKDNKTFYRKKCEICSKYGGIGHGIPKWKQVGYEKKNTCEKCGYTSKHKEQFNVFHIDGTLDNCRFSNLKTICLNCRPAVYKSRLPWRPAEVVQDF